MSLVPFDSVTIDEQHEPMVALSGYPFIVVPVYYRYQWSPEPELFLRRRLADKLLHIQVRELDPRGLKWVVYDAWRPRTVQAAIFQHHWRQMSLQRPELTAVQLREYVTRYVTIPADPCRVPPHSTGGSVDLGLWDCVSDRLLEMGAAFDEFVPAVASSFFETKGRSITIRDRRRRMAEWLVEEGIVGDVDEYFHKDYGNQKWALQAGLSRAVYGEVLECRSIVGRDAAQVLFADEESATARGARIQALYQALDLTHPAVRQAVDLVSPTDLVRAVAGFADVPF